MLLNDRLVGSLGIVAPGDDSAITKVAVHAVRNDLAVVPWKADVAEPACALGVRDSKKPHDCYHVMTEDTKVRAAFNRLTKDGAKVRLALDLEASGLGIMDDVSGWWEGPEISPTLEMPDGTQYYVFDIKSFEGELPERMVTKGSLLVPPSCDNGKPVRMIGQMNDPEEGIAMDMSVWDDKIDALRSENTALRHQVEELQSTQQKMKTLLLAIGATVQDIKGKLDQ
jgi:hypothetical protein